MSGSSGFAERSRRHGFVAGARMLYEAIYQHVPPADQVLVKQWFSNIEYWEHGELDDKGPPDYPLQDISKTSGA